MRACLFLSNRNEQEEKERPLTGYPTPEEQLQAILDGFETAQQQLGNRADGSVCEMEMRLLPRRGPEDPKEVY